ncbi:hypothetical protein [Sporolactobacillus terrae]|uniref:Uncharacterized protein n=1 Tax=Sporolactobacillus terrae TaxID=269673 RepID=A0A5K7WZN0_9BACL|nr:hypothetical protein [Sporolactobacillus terrae]BBN99189.1 hypothetical protein St703_18940 [Sporolactobacillus terrae]
MNLASAEIVLSGKYSGVTWETKKAALVFISFCELEQRMQHRPRLCKWIRRMQAKYYNRFICGFARDMHWKDQQFTIHTEPTQLFLKFKNSAIKKMEKPSTSAKADDSSVNFDQKSTDAIIAQ